MIYILFVNFLFLRDIVTGFLDSEKILCLLFYLNSKDDLQPATFKFPSNLKKKSIYFLKRNPTVSIASADRLEADLIIGDLSGGQLDHLTILLEDVYSSLICNERNLDSWSHVVADDIVRHYFKLNGNTFTLSGKSKVWHFNFCF